MWNYNYTEDQHLEHAGSKGMRWGYSHGKPNGKRKARKNAPSSSLRKYEGDKISSNYYISDILDEKDYRYLGSKDSYLNERSKTAGRIAEWLRKENPKASAAYIANMASLHADELIKGRQKAKDYEAEMYKTPQYRNYLYNRAKLKQIKKLNDRGLPRSKSPTYDQIMEEKRKWAENRSKARKDNYNKAKEKQLEKYDRRDKKTLKNVLNATIHEFDRKIKAGKKFIENLFK